MLGMTVLEINTSAGIVRLCSTSAKECSTLMDIGEWCVMKIII